MHHQSFKHKDYKIKIFFCGRNVKNSTLHYIKGYHIYYVYEVTNLLTVGELFSLKLPILLRLSIPNVQL